MNVFARTSLTIDHQGLEFLQAADGQETMAIEGRYAGCQFPVWESWYFSHADGLLADPSRLRRRLKPGDSPDERLSAQDLIERFKTTCLLISNPESYRARFAAKTSILDNEHFGNFHQQVGQYLLIKERVSPGTWWVRQKFTEDMEDVRNNLYGAVQKYSLDRYFKRRFREGDVVVDIGCGTGFYANRIAATGARVLGLDPNRDYLEIARRKATAKTQFREAAIGQPDGLRDVASASADYIFMSDALLFYFSSPDPKRKPSVEALLADFRRILKPTGRFISVEPHYVFWLMPWLGDSDRPYTVLTEYAHKTFGVVPALSTLVQTLAQGGLAVTWMEELKPDPDYAQVDPRGYQFAAQFPLWQLLESMLCEPDRRGGGKMP
jgi:SAM-dependent methyltransferase